MASEMHNLRRSAGNTVLSSSPSAVASNITERVEMPATAADGHLEAYETYETPRSIFLSAPFYAMPLLVVNAGLEYAAQQYLVAHDINTRIVKQLEDTDSISM